MSGARGLGLCAGAAGVCALACVSTPDFANSSQVDRPRVLAIVAEPPELAPGQSGRLSIMLAGFDGLDYDISWRACGAYSSMFGGYQYGDEDRDESCQGELSRALGRGEFIDVPGAGTQALFDNIEVAQAALGDLVPPGIVQAVKDEVGLVVTVEAVVETDARVWRATKAVIVNQGKQHENPPPPHFMLGDSEVVARADRAFACEAADGGPVVVALGDEVELAPILEDAAGEWLDEEPWLETYTVINLRGERTEETEQAFYSWYSDAGHLAETTTRAPLRNNVWRLPRESGCRSLWLVVRDGHGGTSACRVPVAIGDDNGACE